MIKNDNIIGQKFGKLLVLEELPERTKAYKKRYKCLCDCGNYHIVVGASLKNGLTKSCGKCKSTITIGKKFGKLTVLEQSKLKRPNGATIYKCLCDCGNISYVDVYSLQNGNTKSCGCLTKSQGGKTTINKRLHHCWCDMKSRCYNKDNKAYNRYGGRGIKVYDEWLNDFQAFYDWSITNDYNDNLTLDRINVDGNYEPNNCRWVDWDTQRNNKSTTIKIVFNGKEQSLSQWCRHFGLKYQTMYSRLKKGIDVTMYFKEVKK